MVALITSSARQINRRFREIPNANKAESGAFVCVLCRIQNYLMTPSLLANPTCQSPQAANHRFEFQKRSQLFIRTQNEALSNGISFFARRRRKLLNNPSQSYPTQPQHDKNPDD